MEVYSGYCLHIPYLDQKIKRWGVNKLMKRLANIHVTNNILVTTTHQEKTYFLVVNKSKRYVTIKCTKKAYQKMKSQISIIKDFLEEKLSNNLDLVIYTDNDQEQRHKFNQVKFVYEKIIQGKEDLYITEFFPEYLKNIILFKKVDVSIPVPHIFQTVVSSYKAIQLGKITSKPFLALHPYDGKIMTYNKIEGKIETYLTMEEVVDHFNDNNKSRKNPHKARKEDIIKVLLTQNVSFYNQVTNYERRSIFQFHKLPYLDKKLAKKILTQSLNHSQAPPSGRSGWRQRGASRQASQSL